MEASACALASSDCELRWNASCANPGRGVTSCASCPLVSAFSEAVTTQCVDGACGCIPAPQGMPPLHRVPAGEWQGSSDCALLGAGLANVSSLSVVEYVELRACLRIHHVSTAARVLHPQAFYDPLEALRVGSHAAIGALFGAMHGNQTTHEMFAQMRIDPAYAVPAASAAAWVREALLTTFPGTVRALQQIPDRGELSLSAKFVGRSAGLVLDQIVLENPLAMARAKKVERAIVERVQAGGNVISSSRRKLLRTPTSSCPLLATLVKDLTVAGSVLAHHMENNVPRAVCRLTTQPPKWNTSCPQPSWEQVPPPSPPPPRSPPSPPRPPSPPPGRNSTIPARTGGVLTRLLFRGVKLASGVSLDSTIDGAITAFTGASKEARAFEEYVVTEAKTALQCSFDTAVQCYTIKGRLTQEVLRYILQVMVISLGLRIFKIGMLSMLLTPFFFLLAWPILMNRTYGLQYGCTLSISPVIPVCLISDVQDLMISLTPSVLPWPAPLVNRTNGTLSVVDCVPLGFGDGLSELRFLAGEYAPLLANTFPQLVSHVNATTIQSQCALLYGFTAVPVVLLILFGIVTALALTHIALVALGYVVSFLAQLQYALLAVFVGVRDL